MIAAVAAVGAAGAAAFAAAVLPAQAVTAPASGCAAVGVITARASTEAPGEGISGALVSQIVKSSRQTVSRASVNYPATLTNYAASANQGITALTTQLTQAVQKCPNQKIVLIGYSQGAHVVGDVLSGGGGGILGAATAPVPASVAGHVAAVVQFGDPRHVINQAFDRGTSTRNGLFPRNAAQLRALSASAAKIQSFCDSGDPFCDSGANTVVHLTYLNRDQNTAAQFVLGRIGG